MKLCNSKENCNTITRFVRILQLNLRDFHRYISEKQYQRAKVETRIINRQINEKREYFRWYSMEKQAEFQMDLQSLEDESGISKEKGFWPALVSEDGKYLVIANFSNEIQFVSLEDFHIDVSSLNNASGISELTPKVIKNYLDGYFIISGDKVIARCKGEMPGLFIGSRDGNRWGELTAMEITEQLPERLAYCESTGDYIASYDGKHVQTPQTFFKAGKAFTDHFHGSHEGIQNINFSKNGKLVFTKTENGCFCVWDFDKSECLTSLGKSKQIIPLQNDYQYLDLHEDKIILQKIELKDSGEVSVISGRYIVETRDNEEFYSKIAIDREETRLIAVKASGMIDIFSIHGGNPMVELDASEEVGNAEIMTLNVGIDDKIVMGLDDGRVIVFGKKREN